jgi:peptidoglycan/xylan/chitin deacetylase (PgdA/CDA1 family)
MLKVRNITIVYFVALWFIYNTSIFDPLIFWIALPAYLIIPVTASFFICANLYLKAICKGSKEKNNIVISFNLAGPGEKWVQLNEILKRNKIPAIFFVTGETAESSPGLVTKLAESENLIGNLSFNTSGRFGFYSARRLLTELHNTEEFIYQATGKEVQYFRPPLGITNPAVRKATEVIRYQVIGWSKRIKVTDDLFKEIPVTGIKNGYIIRVDFTGNKIPESFNKFLIALKETFNIVPLNELINSEIENESIK